jgi:hypothetical protein
MGSDEMRKRIFWRTPNSRMAAGGAALVVLLLPLLLDLLIPSTWKLLHVPLHAMVGTMGCAVALGAAGIKFVRLRTGQNTERVWLAGGLMSMGLLDAAHGATMPGIEAFWLHSSSLCMGGLMSSLVCRRSSGCRVRMRVAASFARCRFWREP